ncbi:MAG: hypothetical protein ACYC3S_08980 [Chloroflexota bacterium]
MELRGKSGLLPADTGESATQARLPARHTSRHRWLEALRWLLPDNHREEETPQPALVPARVPISDLYRTDIVAGLRF